MVGHRRGAQMSSPLVFPSYEDNRGVTQHPPQEIVDILIDRLGTDQLPDAPGIPGRAHAEARRVSGLAVQLYALRHEGDWGVGDFAGLAKLCAWGAENGLRYIGVNPLHALRTAKAEASPYYPVSRLALHPLYISVPKLAQDLGVPVKLGEADRGALEAERGTSFIDYDLVAQMKFSALRDLFRRIWNEIDLSDFEEKQNGALLGHAIWEAYDHLEASPPPTSLLQDPASFLCGNVQRSEVAFHLFLQWAADRQLRQAMEAGGSQTSLYLDLAVGAAPDGSEVRSHPSAYVEGIRLGAPPDMMGPEGQDWGITPLDPVDLSRNRGVAFRRILDASAQYAGAVRIDHALGLQRQFFIPETAAAKDATYVGFPRELLFSVVAEVSRQRRCTMIGEALGTVPEGLVDAMHDRSIFSYEVTRWARDKAGDFLQPSDYPELCLAAATTHDIAPIAGWLSGFDLETRLEVGHLSAGHLAEERRLRSEERGGLLDLWQVSPRASTADVVVAAHEFLAATKARVAMMTLEDLLLQQDMMNLPGTTSGHPNWRRRYAKTFEEWSEIPSVIERLKAGLR